MAIREISPEYWGAVSGGNGHSNYEGGNSGNNNKGGKKGGNNGNGGGAYRPNNPESFQKCAEGIFGGMVAGSIGGAAGGLAGAIGGGIASCFH